MLIDEKEKNFFSDTEINEIINYLSYELILDNLRKQIGEEDARTYGKVNYLEIFNDKFNYIVLNYNSNQEIMNKLNLLRDEFYSTVLEEIQDKFGFKLKFKDILLKEEFYGIIDCLYSFFIIEIGENLKNFFVNYIRKEYKNILRNFRNQINFKDLYFSLLKKKYNKENSIILYSINKIPTIIEIQFIEDFIDLIIKDDEDEYNNFIINKLFNTEEFIDDVTCDISILKELVKDILTKDTLIQQQVKAVLGQEFLGKGE